jgi:hypothetical protein
MDAKYRFWMVVFTVQPRYHRSPWKLYDIRSRYEIGGEKEIPIGRTADFGLWISVA